MTEVEKTHWAFSYPLVSLLDFGIYIQTGWDWIYPYHASKFPGQDNLSAEVFKADPQLAADQLQSLFTGIWEGKKLPEDWTEGVIVKIPKKSALNNCNNWRGITLLSVPSKILAKIIIQRIADTVDQQLRRE